MNENKVSFSYISKKIKDYIDQSSRNERDKELYFHKTVEFVHRILCKRVEDAQEIQKEYEKFGLSFTTSQTGNFTNLYVHINNELFNFSVIISETDKLIK